MYFEKRKLSIMSVKFQLVCQSYFDLNVRMRSPSNFNNLLGSRVSAGACYSEQTNVVTPNDRVATEFRFHL